MQRSELLGTVLASNYSWNLVSSVVALGALMIGLASLRTARRALKISFDQESRQQPGLALHLNEALSLRRPQLGDRLIFISLLVSNPTDRSSSLVRADLILSYVDRGNDISIRIPHEPRSNSLNGPLAFVPTELPLSLGANQALAGWYAFRIPDQLTRGQQIARYDIEIRDVHDVIESLQMTVFREIDENETP